MSTESVQRSVSHGPMNRLALAVVDLLTGVTEASIEQDMKMQGQRNAYPCWTLKIRKSSDIQDD